MNVKNTIGKDTTPVRFETPDRRSAVRMCGRNLSASARNVSGNTVDADRVDVVAECRVASRALATG